MWCLVLAGGFADSMTTSAASPTSAVRSLIKTSTSSELLGCLHNCAALTSACLIIFHYYEWKANSGWVTDRNWAINKSVECKIVIINLCPFARSIKTNSPAAIDPQLVGVHLVLDFDSNVRFFQPRFSMKLDVYRIAMDVQVLTIATKRRNAHLHQLRRAGVARWWTSRLNVDGQCRYRYRHNFMSRWCKLCH